jgi:hypothetical protein
MHVAFVRRTGPKDHYARAGAVLPHRIFNVSSLI